MDLTAEPYQIDYLYHLTSPDNLPSILQNGLLSRNRAYQGGYVMQDIAHPDVNHLRSGKEVYGRPLHDYVSLYFTAKGPMLHRRQGEYRIAILYMSRRVLAWSGAIFSDGNAASWNTSFFDNLRDIDKVDWERVRAERWEVDPKGPAEGRRKRCAEVLVPDAVPARFIRQIAVRTEEIRAAVAGSIGPEISVVVRPELYFG